MPQGDVCDISIGKAPTRILLTLSDGSPWMIEDYSSHFRDWRLDLEKQGLTYDIVRRLAPSVQSTTSELKAFLIYSEPASGDRHRRIEDGLQILVLHHLSTGDVPIFDLEPGSPPDQLQTWRGYLEARTPAFESFARFVLKTCDIPDAKIMLDLNGLLGADLCAFLPVSAKDHVDAILNALLSAKHAGPPSNHALIEALPRLRWRYDPEEIPGSSLPGLSAPI